MLLWKFFTRSLKGIAAAAKWLLSCLTLCDPIGGSPPGCPVPGILQARTLEWVAISFSSTWKWKVKVKSLSRVRLFVTPWTAAHQAPPFIGFSRQEYWSGVPLPSPLKGITKMKFISEYPGVLWIEDYRFEAWKENESRDQLSELLSMFPQRPRGNVMPWGQAFSCRAQGWHITFP